MLSAPPGSAHLVLPSPGEQARARVHRHFDTLRHRLELAPRVLGATARAPLPFLAVLRLHAVLIVVHSGQHLCSAKEQASHEPATHRLVALGRSHKGRSRPASDATDSPILAGHDGHPELTTTFEQLLPYLHGAAHGSAIDEIVGEPLLRHGVATLASPPRAGSTSKAFGLERCIQVEQGQVVARRGREPAVGVGRVLALVCGRHKRVFYRQHRNNRKHFLAA
mmetsp:Transcript_100854/g.245214  ORF Transcript_100854/g.245214 Transcript_100854/m.245214 type:complete len:223 (-) Transcript_100854:143-811(-)